jgi:DNA polymerase IV
MPAEAGILHADADSFYASVEQRDDPTLRGKPVIVGPGIVLAASYEAKAFGVYTPMPVSRAKRLCPGAVVVSARMSAYSDASKALFEVFNDFSGLVEGISIDEAFLDVRGLRRLSGAPIDIAARLKKAVRERVGLPLSIGIARTKFLAKVASGVSKPDGLLLVPPESELDFLHPLPVEALWGVGVVTSKKLRSSGITTVRQVAQLSEQTLVQMLGRGPGRQIHALSHNRDPRPVTVGRRRRSMGSQRAIGRGNKSASSIDALLVGIVDRLARRMRSARRVCRTVILRLRFDDLSRATRSHTLPQATSDTRTILATARELVTAATPMIEAQGVTLVGLTLTNLEHDSAVQLALPFDRLWAPGIDVAIDDLRERFGSSAITRGVLLGRDQGMSVPLLPD